MKHLKKYKLYESSLETETNPQFEDIIDIFKDIKDDMDNFNVEFEYYSRKYNGNFIYSEWSVDKPNIYEGIKVTIVKDDGINNYNKYYYLEDDELNSIFHLYIDRLDNFKDFNCHIYINNVSHNRYSTLDKEKIFEIENISIIELRIFNWI